MTPRDRRELVAELRKLRGAEPLKQVEWTQALGGTALVQSSPVLRIGHVPAGTWDGGKVELSPLASGGAKVTSGSSHGVPALNLAAKYAKPGLSTGRTDFSSASSKLKTLRGHGEAPPTFRSPTFSHLQRKETAEQRRQRVRGLGSLFRAPSTDPHVGPGVYKLKAGLHLRSAASITMSPRLSPVTAGPLHVIQAVKRAQQTPAPNSYSKPSSFSRHVSSKHSHSQSFSTKRRSFLGGPSKSSTALLHRAYSDTFNPSSLRSSMNKSHYFWGGGGVY